MMNMTDWFPRNPVTTMFRLIFSLIDSVVYWLMTLLYELFFAVAGVDFLGGDILRSIYGRVQLILGVFMIFKLATSILQGIVNPDAVVDKKQGMGTIVTRIIVSLLMLTLIAPINIPSPSNEWEKQVHDNGLLFGTLFSLQNRILSNNTIGRLIVGANVADEIGSSKNLAKTGKIFSTTVLKTFIGINVTKSGEVVCPNIDSSIKKIINSKDSSPGEVLALVNVGCSQASNGSASNNLFINTIQEIIGTESYVFSYFFIISTIAGIIIDIVLIGYSVDIAIRVFKLAILRLIAPIPIISHMNISSREAKGDDAFSSWTRALTSTYIDLFIRLAVIYFGLFIIQAILANGLNITNYNSSGAINIFATLFIIIGLMLFIKQAPKYIKDALGIKGGVGSIGLSSILGGAAMAFGGGGAAGFALGALNAADSSLTAINQGKSYGIGDAWNQQKDLMAKIRTGDKDARGGLLGNMQDRFNFATRERQARALGIGAKDVADAEYIKKVRESQAETAKRELDYATAAYNNLSPTATAEERRAAEERYKEAYEVYTNYQMLAGKAASNYEKMDKDRGQMGVGPRISDKRRNKYSAKYKHNKDDYENANIFYREGTYRTPISTKEDPYKSAQANRDYEDLKKNQNVKDKDILSGVSGHKRDLKNFSGTTDDSTHSSSGKGSRQ